MPALALPLTFANSFWSQDYRRGLETIYAKLDQGIAENDEIVAFISARVAAENALADSLTYPALTGPQGTGFGADDGASLFVAFRGLQAESVKQGEAHRFIAKELDTLVVDPFDQWAQGHKERVRTNRTRVIDGWLKAYELAQGDVDKLKHQYLSKMRLADEAEDDAKFAPNNELTDKYTTSPRLGPRDPRPLRTASVSERIAQRIKDIQGKKFPPKIHEDSPLVFESKSPQYEPEVEGKPLPKIDKGKGKAVEPLGSPTLITSPPPLSPPLPPSKLNVKPPPSPVPPGPLPPILLAGLALPPQAVSDLLKRAAEELPLRSVKIPILGEYRDCFTGEEFVTWLKESVQGFGGSFDRAEDAARDLTEKEGVLRRIGELGNKFETSDEAYYQFRPKAFNLHAEHANVHEDITTSPTMVGLSPMADNLVKRSNTFVNMVSKALNANTNAEPLHVRTRYEADASDRTYRVAVRKLDRQRLGLEERIDETLKMLQKWEMDRLHAVKTVLLQYHGTLSNLPGALQSSMDRSSILIASYQPESDLKALIERYRTGPFRPAPQVYESITHDEFDVVFGIDLRKWADGGWDGVRGGVEKRDKIPEVVTALLAALTEAYKKLPTDAERRKTWIYEVPLAAVHHLRESINAVPPGKSITSEMLAKYDAPVLASGLKLWALELDPPLGMWEGWEDIRHIYPIVGAPAKADEETSEKQRIQDLQVALQRLPKVHLLVLDTLLSHLKTLIDTTTVEESNDIYVTKLALSIGRTLLRPKFESEMSIQDRHPTLLAIDLLKHYDEILPPTIVKKKRESDRKIPLRKRTAPIDMRMSRSRLSVDADAHEILAAQLAAKNPNFKPPSRAPSPTIRPQVAQPTAGPVASQPSAAPAVAASTPATPDVISPSEPEKTASSMTESSLPTVADPTPGPVDADVTPRRPIFKEPPPETEDDPPPMPKFIDPPPEVEGPTVEAPSAPVVVSPSTPLKRASKLEGSPGRTTSPGRKPSSPTSPVLSNDDRPGANLSRSSSAEASRVRGPRSARLPRPTSTNGSVAAMVSGLNRNSGQTGTGVGARLSRSPAGRPTSVANARDYEPKGKHGGRAQAGVFSRRTMASDAEDEVTDK